MQGKCKKRDRSVLNAMSYLLVIGNVKYYSNSSFPKSGKITETLAEIRLGKVKAVLNICDLSNFPVFSHE